MSDVEKFRSQIENSLEQRANSPELSERQAEALRILKQGIIKIIAKRSRKLLGDLTLDQKEFGSIFEELRKDHEALFEEMGIFDPGDFEAFLGINNAEKTEYVEHNGEVDLFGVKAKLVLPLGLSKRMMSFYLKAVECINRRKALKPYVKDGMELVPLGDDRLEFVIVKDGKSVKYCANFEKVLRVDKELSVEKRRELVTKRIELAKLKRIQNPDPELAEKISELERTVNKLIFDSEGRFLFDEDAGMVIDEYEMKGANIYSWTYLDKGGATTKNLSYMDGRKLSETEYEPGGTTEKTETIYRADGTKRLKTVGTRNYLYDGAGEKIITMSEGNDAWLMVADDGETAFGSFAHEISKNPQMAELQYLAKFKDVIKNAEQYYIFEELFLTSFDKESASLRNEIRSYGMKITGIKKLEERFAATHGIHIHTEEFGRWEGKRASLGAIRSSINKIAEMIEMYPPGFVKMYLKNIYLCTNLVGEGVRADGAASESNVILDLPLRRDTFHHEFFHCLDRRQWFANDNHNWGIGAYGENYQDKYRSLTMKEIGELEESRPEGFPSLYASLRGINEDQADVAMALMMNDKSLLRLLKEEPALRAKFRMMMKRYYEASDGMMDLRFWNDLRRGVKIDRRYWRKREKERPKRGRPREGMTDIGF